MSTIIVVIVSARWQAAVPKFRTERLSDLDLCPFDLKSGARVTCVVGYLCANFGLPKPLDLGQMYVTDRQTDVRQKHRLMSPPIRCGGIINRPPPLRLAGYVIVTLMIF